MTAGGSHAAWGAWRSEVASRLRGLGDGDLVEVAVPDRARSTLVRSARWLGLVSPVRRDVVPRLRLVRQEEHLRAECSGHPNAPADLRWRCEELEALTRLGWRTPSGQGPWLVHWFPDDLATEPFGNATQLEAAVDLVTRTLRGVLEVGDPVGARLRHTGSAAAQRD